jgi:signal peptidase I
MEEKGLMKIIKELVPYILIIVVVLLFKLYIMTPVRVNGSSMAPTLQDGDLMILDIISFKLSGAKRFDVLVADQGEELLIKRVIGLPGEKVEVRLQQLYLNLHTKQSLYVHDRIEGGRRDIK